MKFNFKTCYCLHKQQCLRAVANDVIDTCLVGHRYDESIIET
jgi:hypothetical protein